MNSVQAFRNHMAEQGYEYTPGHAADILDAVEELRQNVHDEARVNPERYEHMANMTWEEKRQVCRDHGIKPSEIDGIIEIILQVYEQERLF